MHNLSSLSDFSVVLQLFAFSLISEFPGSRQLTMSWRPKWFVTNDYCGLFTGVRAFFTVSCSPLCVCSQSYSSAHSFRWLCCFLRNFTALVSNSKFSVLNSFLKVRCHSTSALLSGLLCACHGVACSRAIL